jgi:hypothetical protein
MSVLGNAAQAETQDPGWTLCQLQNSGEMKLFLKNGSWSPPPG